MNDELEELTLFMATLGWVYGKYDDQCFHIFDDSGNNTMTIKQAESLKAHTDKAVKESNDAKDNAYRERNQLVAYLASKYESHMVRHPDDDKDWEDDWRWIVCIHTPAGQMTWHIHEDEVRYFGWLVAEPDAGHWDGHTTEEKYARLKELQEGKE